VGICRLTTFRKDEQQRKTKKVFFQHDQRQSETLRDKKRLFIPGLKTLACLGMHGRAGPAVVGQSRVGHVDLLGAT
jgi:hypothetical protein